MGWDWVIKIKMVSSKTQLMVRVLPICYLALLEPALSRFNFETKSMRSRWSYKYVIEVWYA